MPILSPRVCILLAVPLIPEGNLDGSGIIWFVVLSLPDLTDQQSSTEMRLETCDWGIGMTYCWHTHILHPWDRDSPSDLLLSWFWFRSHCRRRHSRSSTQAPGVCPIHRWIIFQILRRKRHTTPSFCTKAWEEWDTVSTPTKDINKYIFSGPNSDPTIWKR